MSLSPDILKATGFVQSVPQLPQAVPHTPPQSQPYPVDAFPPILRNVISALYDDTQIPIELIGNVVLAAVSLACQSHIEVVPAHTSQPEPCCLYLLTIAESGEGKTTISKQIMKPFDKFVKRMEQDYQERLKNYEDEHGIWKIGQQAYKSLLSKAFKSGKDIEKYKAILAKHAILEPVKPVRAMMLYEDVTKKSFIEEFTEHTEVALMSDEAITFFKGYIRSCFGLLNKAWDGECYIYQRSGEPTRYINARLTLSLMAQPKVLDDYLEKNGDLAKGSGFLSRFLFARVISTIGHRHRNDSYVKSDEALNTFYEKINSLLEKQYKYFHSEFKEKKALVLSNEARSLLKNKRAETETRMGPAQCWEHIRDIASKSGANIIRLAGMLTYLEDEQSAEISSATLDKASKIIDWYLHQASELFYSDSERYQFEQDVYELFSWIKDKFIQTNDSPIRKNHILQAGPNRLRHSHILDPLLEQLIALGRICSFKATPNSVEYIAMPMRSNISMWNVPHNLIVNEHSFILRHFSNTRGRYDNSIFDNSKLYY